MPNTTVLLRLPQVRQRCGLSRSSIYLLVSRGLFPEPVPVGARSIAWVESEVEDWLRSRIAERDHSAPMRKSAERAEARA